MNFGSVLLGLLAFVVLLSIIIIIHELGHVDPRHPLWRVCDDGRGG